MTGSSKIKFNNRFHTFLFYVNTLFNKNMAMEKKLIEQLIKNSIPDANIVIDDLKGDGDHYSATVISKTFEGKSRIEQHKMVYESLEGKMGNELHALMLKTKTE